MESTNLIPDFKLESLKAELVKLNKKAVKFGLNPFTMTDTNEYEERYITFERDEFVTKTLVRFHKVILTGDEVKLNGWVFLAGIDHDDKYNTVKVMSGVTLDKDYTNASANCDHCGYKRLRKNTYIVQHEDTGETLQVGSTCVKDFTGHGDAEQILRIFARFNTLFETRDEDSYGGFKFEDRYETKYYVQLVAQIVLDYGFTSKKKALERDLEATSWFADRVYYPQPRQPRMIISDEAKEMTKYVLTEHVESLKAIENRNEFEQNVLNFLSDSSFKCKYSAFVAAGAFFGMKKLMTAKEPAEPKEERSNEFVGNPGDKLEKTLTVTASGAFDSQWGGGMRYNFRDEPGNSYTWFSTSRLKLEVAQSYNLKFKLKKHNTWKDMKQNMISHVKITS